VSAPRGHVSRAGMMTRFTRYCELREAGTDAWDARLALDVSEPTAAKYERSYRAVLRGETLADAVDSRTRSCDVWRSGVRNGNCTDLAAIPYRAACACGHPVEGTACRACMASASLGCLSCWQQDEDVRHKCRVTFQPEARMAVAAHG
jgi:hypothetical protein